MVPMHGGSFTAVLFRYPGKGGWHFAPVPERLAIPAKVRGAKQAGDRVRVQLRFSL